MKWIESSGGPLILCSSKNITYWGGAGRSSDAFQSDYQLACAVNKYIGVVSIGSGEALVLGDEPNLTSFIECRPGYYLLARIIYADKYPRVSEIIEISKNTEFDQSAFHFEMDYNEAVLFDATEIGDELFSIARSDEYIISSMVPGKYDITTKRQCLMPETMVMLHMLKLRN